MKVYVIPTADEIEREHLSGKTTIILDILRATSTIVTAMASGCREVVPVETVADAFSISQKRPDAILGGERKSQLIPGFHLGNSPLEYKSEKVGDKAVVFTTTNGTRAILRAAAGDSKVLIGSLLNAGAVAGEATNTGRDIVLVCAGTRGMFSLEDMVAAGIIMREIYNLGGKEKVMPGSDLAVAALRLGEFYIHNPLQALYDSLHGQKLAAMGLAKDLEWCARLNYYDVVPVYRSGTVTVKSRHGQASL